MNICVRALDRATGRGWAHPRAVYTSQGCKKVLWGGFGRLWGALGDVGGVFGESVGGFREALGKLWEALGIPTARRRTTKTAIYKEVGSTQTPDKPALLAHVSSSSSSSSSN